MVHRVVFRVSSEEALDFWEERLRAEGVDDAGLGRIHAPIGLAIGARSPEEVAVAIGAEIVEATALARRRAAAGTGAVSLLST